METTMGRTDYTGYHDFEKMRDMERKAQEMTDQEKSWAPVRKMEEKKQKMAEQGKAIEATEEYVPIKDLIQMDKVLLAKAALQDENEGLKKENEGLIKAVGNGWKSLFGAPMRGSVKNAMHWIVKNTIKNDKVIVNQRKSIKSLQASADSLDANLSALETAIYSSWQLYCSHFKVKVDIDRTYKTIPGMFVEKIEELLAEVEKVKDAHLELTNEHTKVHKALEGAEEKIESLLKSKRRLSGLVEEKDKKIQELYKDLNAFTVIVDKDTPKLIESEQTKTLCDQRGEYIETAKKKVKELESKIEFLDKENGKLVTTLARKTQKLGELTKEIGNAHSTIEWQKTYTRLDGEPNHPRPIQTIIDERDSALEREKRALKRVSEIIDLRKEIKDKRGKSDFCIKAIDIMADRVKSTIDLLHFDRQLPKSFRNLLREVETIRSKAVYYKTTAELEMTFKASEVSKINKDIIEAIEQVPGVHSVSTNEDLKDTLPDRPSIGPVTISADDISVKFDDVSPFERNK
jgi:hypothetical protein